MIDGDDLLHMKPGHYVASLYFWMVSSTSIPLGSDIFNASTTKGTKVHKGNQNFREWSFAQRSTTTFFSV